MELYTSLNVDYNNDISEWREIEHQMKCLAEAGFTHTSWMHDWDGEYLYSPSEMLYARDLLKHYGIKSHTCHGTEGGIRNKNQGESCMCTRKDFTNSNLYIREAGVDLVKNRIDFCTHIGAEVLVLHMSIPFRVFQRNQDAMEEYYRQVYCSFDKIQPYAKDAGVKIALENHVVIPAEFQQDKFDRMFDRYDESYMGMCWDSGHATISNYNNFYELLERYGNRLIATHLHDNDSIDPKNFDNESLALKADKHRTPFTGILDWKKVAYWVAKAPLDLPADFEVCLQYGTKYTSKEEEMAALAQVHGAAERFQEMVLADKEA